MKRLLSVIAASATLVAAAIVASPAGAAAPVPSSVRPLVNAYQRLESQSGRQFFAEHGYLPVDGVRSYYQQKIAAVIAVARTNPDAYVSTTSGADQTAQAPQQPVIGASWQGVNYPGIAPPDTNGAIGPQSYIEDINLEVGIYTRTGTLVSSFPFSQLTGTSANSDPMMLWDPDTQRFYYSIMNESNASIDWGFSKTGNPQSASDFCNYDAQFGYQPTNVIDFPKLGQTTNFLMVGINFYPTFSNQHATESDLLWIQKPQGSGPVTTCPAPGTFQDGKFTNLRNQDGSQAFTPVPAIQTDPSKYGLVATMSDIECPDICGTGNLITIQVIRPTPNNPSVPQLLAPRSVKVPAYTSPPPAPEKGSSNTIDTLDGRLLHATSGFDPRVGATTIEVTHTIAGGAGSEARWYEIDPLPFKHPKLVGGGTIQDPSLFVFNPGVSNDRTISSSGQAAHGDAMVVGFTTSSTATYPTDQMIEKVGSSPQSSFVLVHASTQPYSDFTCTPTCRWGDYGGATPDPAASLTAAHGEVWLTNEWDTGGWQTWNWEAKP